MVLFDDVVEVLRLAHLDGRSAVGLNALDSGRVGTALVNVDLLGHIMQSDGLFKNLEEFVAVERRYPEPAPAIHRRTALAPDACIADGQRGCDGRALPDSP